MRDCLRGAYEMHIHTSPDVTARKCSDLELAQRFQEAGLAGALIKCHYADTAARAALLNERFTELKFAGGVTLNRSSGGINPEAVDVSGKMGGKIVWFPTMDSLHYQAFHKKNGSSNTVPNGCLYILDADGQLISEAVAVLETAKKYGMMVGTGHLGPEEGMALVRAGAELGCQIILTHADNPANAYTIQEQCEAAELGAIVEHCYFTTYYRRTPIETITAQIRAVGIEHVILSTDFGQPQSPYSDEGLEQYATLLARQGFSDAELRAMFCSTPARLLGMDVADKGKTFR